MMPGKAEPVAEAKSGIIVDNFYDFQSMHFLTFMSQPFAVANSKNKLINAQKKTQARVLSARYEGPETKAFASRVCINLFHPPHYILLQATFVCTSNRGGSAQSIRDNSFLSMVKSQQLGIFGRKASRKRLHHPCW